MDQKEPLPRASSPIAAQQPWGSPVYDVGIDTQAARRREIGFDPTGQARVCVTLPLSGRVDDRWRRSFRAIQLEDTGYFRFRLELTVAAITFSCAAAGLPEGIRQLKALVELVNRRASRPDR